MPKPPRPSEPASHRRLLAEIPRDPGTTPQPRTPEEPKDEPTSPPALPTIVVTSPASPLSPAGHRKRRTPDSESDTDTGARGKMPSKKHSSSEKGHSSKSKSKNDDWTDVTEPDQRRRIQNRIAQRKFREKAKEQKERAERESRNQEHAGSSYRIPDPSELEAEDADLPGLPWGGINVRHVVARGRENHESRRGSARDDYSQDDAHYHHSQYGSGRGGHDYQQYTHQTPSYGSRGSSGGDDRYYDDPLSSTSYYYCDPNTADTSQQ
ncbi:hypothetical protein DL771_001362 [Monosporascus sp. 5C6A]|nr:hypothetical protein DL771_001362 [Monosporascus sp. 5C6A]